MGLDAAVIENISSIPILSPMNFTDINTELSFKLLYGTFHDELTNISKKSNRGISTLHKKTIISYIEQMKSIHNNTLSSRSGIVKELFILHQMCKCLYLYNQQYLNLSHREFRAKILFPNIVYTLVNLLHNAHKFIQGIIRSVYNEWRGNYTSLISRHANAYYTDPDVVKNDVLYKVLGNAMKKFDPLCLENINYFYKQVFRQNFFYYFKSEEKAHTSYSSIWEMDNNISQYMALSTRLMTYRDVLYKLQTEKMCDDSPTINQLTYNYSIFQNLIISNELRDIYFSCSTDKFILDNEQYKLMKLYYNEEIQEELLSKIKKLPTIYSLLKCVHIINPKYKPYNEMLIKPEIVKMAIYEELYHQFRNTFSQNQIINILDQIAQNFTSSLLTGQYINVLTLMPVRISQVTFIDQVRKFVQLCLVGVIPNESNA